MSDRMITEGAICVYHPSNEYYYDRKDNYEPDMIAQPLGEDLEPTGRKSYTTAQIMGDDETGLPNDAWYQLEEIPDSYISSSGYVWSFGMGKFRIPRLFYPGRKKTPYLVIYAKEGMFYLHRLMAKYFIPNPYNYPIVRHLNDDGLDCQLSNLAWGTQKDNVTDAIRNKKFKGSRLEEVRLEGNSARRCPVIAKSLEDGTEMWFPSTRDAAAACGVSQPLISCILCGKVKDRNRTRRKFTFRRASECP